MGKAVAELAARADLSPALIRLIGMRAAADEATENPGGLTAWKLRNLTPADRMASREEVLSLARNGEIKTLCGYAVDGQPLKWHPDNGVTLDGYSIAPLEVDSDDIVLMPSTNGQREGGE